MGLREYQALAFLAYIAQVGGLCTVSNLPAAGFARSSQLSRYLAGQVVQYTRAGGTDRPSHTKSSLLGHSPPANQVGRRDGPAL
jgi:hypothetical protein